MKELIVFHHDLVLVNLDDTGPLIGDHLAVYFINDSFILEPGQVVNFF